MDLQDADEVHDPDEVEDESTEQRAPEFRQRLADAPAAVLVASLAIFALIFGLVGFAVGVQADGGSGSSGPSVGPPDSPPKMTLPVVGSGTSIGKKGLTFQVKTRSGRIVALVPNRKTLFLEAARTPPTTVRSGSQVLYFQPEGGSPARVFVMPRGVRGAVVTESKPGTLSWTTIRRTTRTVPTIGAGFYVTTKANASVLDPGSQIVFIGSRLKFGISARVVIRLPQ